MTAATPARQTADRRATVDETTFDEGTNDGRSRGGDMRKIIILTATLGLAIGSAFPFIDVTLREGRKDHAAKSG